MAEAYADIDWQLQNQWQLIVTPYFDLLSGGIPIPSTWDPVLRATLYAGMTVLENGLYAFAIQDITVEDDFSLDYDDQWIKGVTPGHKVTISFVEDAYGVVARYVALWKRQVGMFMRIGDPTSPAYKYEGFVFNDDQTAAMRNARLQLLGPEGKPLYPGITLKGLKPATRSGYQLGQGADKGEGSVVEIECYCKKISMKLL